MTKTTSQAAALALSALMTLGVVAGMDGIATTQYATASTLAMAQSARTPVAVQQPTIGLRRA